MSRLIVILTLLTAVSCSQSDPAIVLNTNSVDSLYEQTIRLEIYLTDATKDQNCETHFDIPKIKSDFSYALHYESLVEFESQGFADISFSNIASSKKLLIFILAYDATTTLPIGMACLDNVHVEKNTPREVHVVLTPIRDSVDD